MQLRQYLPKTLFNRLVAIILVPMFLVQLITVLIFFERHWDSVTRQMADALASEIKLLIERLSSEPSTKEIYDLQIYAYKYFKFNVDFVENAKLVNKDIETNTNYTAFAFKRAMNSHTNYLWTAALNQNNDKIFIDIQFPNGILTIKVGKKRLFSSTSLLFIGWTIGSSLILFLIALFFIQGQVKPILRLAVAARQLGLGRDITNSFHLEGAREIRAAGRAFQAMRHRIKRHLNERTTMLAGVSHDLRTPLTRMRLQLELLKKTPEIEELTKDIAEMEAMIEAYLAFSRGEASDPPHLGDIRQLLRDITEQLQKTYPERLTLIFNEDEIPTFPIRAPSLRRALMNILENALRYAFNAEIRVRRIEDTVLIQIDDDGPGIPNEKRTDAILPFKRLEASRNQKTGGTGLGLSIASDIILSHGGQLDLLESPKGGLRVRIILPI